MWNESSANGEPRQIKGNTVLRQYLNDMIGIYKVTNLINGKCYIGQSRNVENRLKDHQKPNRECNPAIREDLLRYGKENFSYEVLEECEASQLNERESYYIRTMKPEYNTKGFTEHGIYYNDKALREKISRANKAWWESLPQETKDKIIKENLTGRSVGYRLTNEQKEHLRQMNLGKKQSLETVNKRKETIRRLKDAGVFVQTNAGHKKPITCLNDGQVYESVKSAAEKYGLRAGTISAVLKGRQKSTGGLKFKYCKV